MGFGISRKITWGLFLGFVAAAGLGAYGEARGGGVAFRHFPVANLAIALALSLVNYGLRWIRWNIFLGKVAIRIRPLQSLLVFGSGLGFSVSPGKAGEFIKSFLLSQEAGVEKRRSAPVVIMERASDLAGVLLLAAGGAVTYGYGQEVMAVGGGLLALMLLVLVCPWIPRWFRSRLPGKAEIFRDMQIHARSLLSADALAAGLLLSVIAWFAECYAFWWVMRGVGENITIAAATSIYCLATLAGAVSFLPGGLVATEGCMVAALSMTGIDAGGAAAATLIIRLCTLWFAVALGVVAFWFWGRLFGVARPVRERSS